ncbi:MAG: 16S rRNA (adenine(1518)-N(6)/adenine(1519)-N(6))-dimethyltransferase RsmA [Clostridiales bacterium]|nr:16S rRNA (adenine(1518)-N(6)/adenine(1519)-N(6))-dimethyltransferase RsmA [Clostridiales bacterium]
MEKQRSYDGANRGELRQALNEYGLAPNKNLGQNFLCDPNACDAIVALAGDLSLKRVLEIGPGAGALTVRLCEQAKSVCAVEIDDGLYRLLSAKLADRKNLVLIHGDGLKVDLPALLGEGPCAVVANLPYYITTPLIMRCLEELPQVDTLVLMMQKEVASRLTAQSGKDYSSISMAVNYHATMEKGLTLPPNCFFPAPKVDSTVVVMKRRRYHLTPADEKLFFRVARSAFAMRRKTILNNLSSAFPKDVVLEALGEVGISPTERGERIPMDAFIHLSDAIGKRL